MLLEDASQQRNKIIVDKYIKSVATLPKLFQDKQAPTLQDPFFLSDQTNFIIASLLIWRVCFEKWVGMEAFDQIAEMVVRRASLNSLTSK